LDRADIRERIVIPLVWATLGYMPDAPSAALYRRQWRYDFNRRAVEISVRFLGIETRQAVESNTARILRLNEALLRQDVQKSRFEVTPCDQIRDLWSYFAIADSLPACLEIKTR
jgi:hypothetical protein